MPGNIDSNKKLFNYLQFVFKKGILKSNQFQNLYS